MEGVNARGRPNLPLHNEMEGVNARGRPKKTWSEVTKKEKTRMIQ